MAIEHKHRMPVIAVFVVSVLCSLATATNDGSITRASLTSNGGQGNGRSLVENAQPLSWDGRRLVFISRASNLVRGDTNGREDAFVRDLVTGTTRRISVDSEGHQANAMTHDVAISGDGRYAAFSSLASNLVRGDANGESDVFVIELDTGLVERVSVGPAGEEADGESGYPSISFDGRFVAFASWARNLAPGDTNGAEDVFLKDRLTGAVELISVGPGGETGSGGVEGWPFISGDGRYVIFGSFSSNLVPGDTNDSEDVFVRDRLSGTTERVSVDSDEVEGNNTSTARCSISSDGRFACFTSYATNLAPGGNHDRGHVFVRDRTLGETILVSVHSDGTPGGDGSVDACISTDGRYVVFASRSSNLVSGDLNGLFDVFARDLVLGETTRVSIDVTGSEADGASRGPGIVHDLDLVVFSSAASNLVPGDHNGESDVFARWVLPNEPRRYCRAKANSLGCLPQIGYRGRASATGSGPFALTAERVLNQQAGFLVYGLAGSCQLPFQGGLLCVVPPLQRLPAVNSGGSDPPAVDCSGVFEFDFNRYVATGADPFLVAGRRVWAQYWSRDPGLPPPGNVGLTDAITFVIGP